MKLFRNSKLDIRNCNKGFTLIETLVALVIFTTSIVGLISVTSTGVANTNYAKNKFIASYLAQEGVEMVRNIRDNSWLFGGATPWADFLDLNPVKGVGLCINSCQIDPETLTVSPCVDPDGCPLYYDYTNSGDGFYTYTGSTPSVFRRKITVAGIGQLSGNAEVSVTSVVSWTQGSVV